MRNIIISLDVGLKGAITILHSDGSITPFKMPVIGEKPKLLMSELNNLLKRYVGMSEVLVVYEKLGQIFESSKATALSMGIQIGAVEMCCIAHGLPYLEIPPKEWQKEMFTGVPEMKKSIKRKNKTGVEKISESRDTKAMAEVAIRRLRPDLSLNFPKMTKAVHDGLVDSVLLGLYVQRKNL